VGTRKGREVRMGDERNRTEPTPEELEQEEGEPLPDREVMSLISTPTIAPEPSIPLDEPLEIPPTSQ
jgi:hypothetical protein